MESLQYITENEYETDIFCSIMQGPSGKKVRGGDSRKMKIYNFFIISV